MLWMLNFITIWVLNLITEFEQKIENKMFWEAKTLDDQEWHLALEIPTSETTHVEREERTHLESNNNAKPEQLKLSKTDLSKWP
jgi:hypothetical protein